MRERLIDALKRAGLSDRTQKIIMLSPGVLFGFPEPNLDKMIERIDCRECQYITEVTSQLVLLLLQIDEKVREIVEPVVKANNILIAKNSWWQNIPLIGRFFRHPTLEKIPDYKKENWYLRGMEAVNQKEGALKLLEWKHPKHWGTPEEEKISKQTIARLLTVDDIYITTLENKLRDK